MRAYSQDLRDRFIFTYKNGQQDPKQLAIIYQVCSKTAKNWIKKFEETGDYRSKQGFGCGRKPRFDDKNIVLRFLENNPDADGIEIRDNVASGIPISTFYDSLARMGELHIKKRQNTKKECNILVTVFKKKSLHFYPKSLYILTSLVLIII